jgi:hypothetical protein
MQSRAFRLILVATAIGLFVGLAPASAQKRGDDANRASKNGGASAAIGDVDVEITYGRPKVKKRTIWGALVPYGEVWRTGADEATTITFSDDVEVEGEALTAGTYSLFTVPSEGSWTVIFNKVPNQWGAFRYNQSEDALRVSVEPTTGEHVEELTFEIGGDAGTVLLSWEKVRVPISISAG